MTPNELTTLLAEPLGRQFDEPFKLMLFDRASIWHARLLRNTIEKDPRRRKEFLSSIVVEAGPRKSTEVPIPIEVENLKGLGFSVSESIKTIPKGLFVNGILFDYVGSVDGTVPYSQISSPAILKYDAHNKYQRDFDRYSYLNGKIQVYGNAYQSRIRLDGIFPDLKAVMEVDCEEYDFWNTDLSYPKEFLQQIVQYVSQDIAPNSNQKTDELNITSNET